MLSRASQPGNNQSRDKQIGTGTGFGLRSNLPCTVVHIYGIIYAELTRVGFLWKKKIIFVNETYYQEITGGKVDI